MPNPTTPTTPTPLSVAAALVDCPWCDAPAGRPCVTRAAHPTTGRGVLLPVPDHCERVRALYPETECTQ